MCSIIEHQNMLQWENELINEPICRLAPVVTDYLTDCVIGIDENDEIL